MPSTLADAGSATPVVEAGSGNGSVRTNSPQGQEANLQKRRAELRATLKAQQLPGAQIDPHRLSATERARLRQQLQEQENALGAGERQR